ncbi:hypothetical protein AZOA_46890 [Azoarcus sp. Aa7]|nr:hypothetical protein [Azoarcus sp. Aa7]
MNTERETITPIVPWRDLWPEILGLIASVMVPVIFLVFDLADKEPDLFQRSGTVTLFVVVVLQFKSLSDLNQKHINNALRAKGVLDGKIQNVSSTRINLSWLVLIVAIYGAAISAFGDKFVVALIKLLCL